jgi:hypothetical protein
VTRRRVAVVCASSITAALVLLLPAPAANADPDDVGCDFTHTCSYDPPWSGPLMPTWDTPHTNGGWSNVPQICSPVSYRCGQYATP